MFIKSSFNRFLGLILPKAQALTTYNRKYGFPPSSISTLPYTNKFTLVKEKPRLSLVNLPITSKYYHELLPL
jgi:hypothetical protein